MYSILHKKPSKKSSIIFKYASYKLLFNSLQYISPFKSLFGLRTFFFLKDFLMWTTFKVFIEFVTILLLFYVLGFWPWGTWDLSSPTRNQTCTPCIGRWSLNHWTTRVVLLRTLIRNKNTLNSLTYSQWN